MILFSIYPFFSTLSSVELKQLSCLVHFDFFDSFQFCQNCHHLSMCYLVLHISYLPFILILGIGIYVADIGLGTGVGFVVGIVLFRWFDR